MLCLVALIAMLACSPGYAASADVTQRVRAIGVAVSAPGDSDTACRDARRQALRQAVEEGVGVLVTSTTKVRNFAVIDDQILSATKGYVRSYELVERATADDGSCRVTVDALVDMGQLHEELAALELAAMGAGLPRVLCRAEERVDAQVVEWGIVDARLQELVAGMTDLLEVSVSPRATSGEADDMRADIVIDASAAANATAPAIPLAGRRVAASGLSTASATLQVRIAWVDEQAPVAILHANGRGVGSSPRAAAEGALEHAVAEMADSLRVALAEDLRQRAFSVRTTELIVEGLHVSQDLDELMRTLGTAIGPVQSLVPRAIDTEAARFQVQSTRGAFELARQLSAHGLQSFPVEIRQVSANRLRVALQTGLQAPR